MTDRHAPGGTAPRSSAPDPLLDRVLEGRYLIQRRIARGGMAAVYEALDLRLDRTVAVKVMHAGLGDDEEFAARFVREARAAARLSHPNVVSVHDQGTDDGVVFLAMEYVSGHTLRDVIAKESPMPPRRALALLEPVVSALAAAHRTGLVHRDVKPENVLIADDGRVKVADFGLAKAISADTQHTATGVLIGTVSYIAPELVTEGRSDARADVYAVGVILYELLTGQKPHTGETPIQVAYRHVHTDVPPPSRLRPGIEPYVDALVARATARDRGLRPADAGVLLHQLHRVDHALAAGVADDVELTADLTPHLRAAEETPAARRGDTTPEPWDAAEMAALLGPPPPPPGPTSGPPTSVLPTRRPPPTTPKPPAVSTGPAPRRTRRSRRGPLLLVLALVVAAAVGGGAYWFGWARYTSTPGVLGLSSSAAQARMSSAGLHLDVDDRAYSDTVAAGRIITTSPAPGDRVLGGGTIEATVSLGVEQHPLPALAGDTVGAATRALAAIEATPGRTIRRYSETVAAGTVIATRPAPGTELRPGADVRLVVSRGRQPIAVGSWVGKPVDQATAALTARGLRVDSSQTAYSTTVAAGAVISQTPPGGTLFRGETVRLVASRGPQLVAMPQVRAHGVESATSELEGLGLKVHLEKTDGYLGLGYVFSTDPAAGTMVPIGSTVILYLV